MTKNDHFETQKCHFSAFFKISFSSLQHPSGNLLLCLMAYSIGLVLTEVDYDFVEQVSVVVFNDPPGGDHLFDLFVVELAVFAEHIVRDLLAARRFDEDDERLQILFPHDGNGRRVHHTNGDASARHHRSDRVDRRPVQILLIFSFFHKLRGLNTMSYIRSCLQPRGDKKC